MSRVPVELKSRSGPLQLAAAVVLQEVPEDDPGRLLVLGAPEPGLPAVLATRFPEATYVHHHYGVHLRDRDPAVPERFRFAARPPEGVWERALCFHPKSREMAQWILAGLGRATAEGGTVWMVGENRSGIRSSVSLLEETIGPLEVRRSAKHCLALRAVRRGRVAQLPPERVFPVRVGGRELTIVSLPGVFSHGRLDDGTALLLAALEEAGLGRRGFRRALDWGAGNGVLGAALATLVPEGEVDCADADAMALEAARATMARNRLPVRVLASDGFSDLGGPYDLIVSNPPFHAGIRTDSRAARRFLEEAPRHLSRKGSLWMVANAFLDHGPVLRAGFDRVRTVHLTTRYRVLEARRGTG